MLRIPKRLMARLIRIYDDFRGERNMRVLEVNASPHEVYRFTTVLGGEIVLYCTETVYEVQYRNWWARNHRHHIFNVYGVCGPQIPQELASRIGDGYRISRLLPRWAARADQKKAAIHMYISLIVNELEGER